MLIQEAWVLGKVVMDGAQREGSQGLRVSEEKRKRGLRNGLLLTKVRLF